MPRPSSSTTRRPARVPTRAELGLRRLRGLARLAVPERPVHMLIEVEPCVWRPAEERLLAALREVR